MSRLGHHIGLSVGQCWGQQGFHPELDESFADGHNSNRLEIPEAENSDIDGVLFPFAYDFFIKVGIGKLGRLIKLKVQF